jgi:Tyrosine phosphatase family
MQPRIAALLVALFSVGCSRLADVDQPCSSHAKAQHPAPGTSIIRFAQIDAGVYRGSKPRTDADFRFLQSKHIRYILQARFLPFLTGPEMIKARAYGMTFLSVHMNASPIPPLEKHVDRILLTLRDKRCQPIYFHCDIGRDRTLLIAALYEMYFLGASQETAWKNMRCDGFKDSWMLRGLKAYFKNHTKPSPALTAAASALNK